tara:strand:- start:63 stop:401 length:339 start_codon:yes stop_codon:yes gene_type:complete
MATDYAYDIELSKDKKHLTLKVELPERHLAREPILECTDTNALDIIKQDGYGNYRMVQTCGALSNWVSREGKGGNRSGVWIFEKVVKTTAKKTTTKKTTTRKTTAKKTTTTN